MASEQRLENRPRDVESMFLFLVLDGLGRELLARTCSKSVSTLQQSPWQSLQQIFEVCSLERKQVEAKQSFSSRNVTHLTRSFLFIFVVFASFCFFRKFRVRWRPKGPISPIPSFFIFCF